MTAHISKPPDAPAGGAGQFGAGVFLVALLGARVIAGVADNWFATGASEIVTLALLASLSAMFFWHMTLVKDAGLALAGIFLWLLLAGVSFMVNDVYAPAKSYQQIALLALYGLALNQFILTCADPRMTVLIQRFLIAFICLGGALSLQQMVSGGGFSAAGKPMLARAFGTDVHPVSWAMQIVCALAGVEVIRRAQGARLNWPLGLVYSLGACSLYLTYSRTGWAMAAFIIIFVTLQDTKGARRAIWAGLIGLFFAAAAIASQRFSDLASVTNLLRRYDFSAQSYNHTLIDNSFSWRLVNWNSALQLAGEHLLIGVGPGQSALLSQFNLKMHNLFLEAFVEAGGPGLCAVVMIVTGLFTLIARIPTPTKAQIKAKSPVVALGGAMLLAVLLSTSLIEQTVTVLIFFLVIGVAMGSPPAHPDHKGTTAHAD